MMKGSIMTERHEEKTLKDVVKMVISHFRVFSAGAAIFIIAVMVVTHYIPVKYTSTALFERRCDSVVNSISRTGESFQTMRLTLQQDLAGPKAVEKVLDKLGLFKNLPRQADGSLTPEGVTQMQDIVQSVIKGLRVEWKVRTDEVDSIAVSCTSSDAKLAQEIPNLLVQQYTTWVNEKILERLRSSRDFIQKQVDKCTAKLSKLNSEKIEFEAKYGDILLSDATNLRERTQELYSDIESLRRQYVIAYQKVKQIKALMQTTQLRKLRDKLEQLKGELDTCLTLNQMTQEHPKVQILLARIKQTQERIQDIRAGKISSGDSEKDGMDNAMILQLASVESEAQMIKDQITLMQRRLATYKTVMTRSVPLREEYAKITKPFEEQEAETKRWQQQLADLNISITAEEGNRRNQLNAVQMAQKPIKPMFPPLWAVVCIAIGGGLAFGYGLAFTSDMMDRTIRKPQDAEKYFGVPVVGVISEIENPKQRKYRQLKQCVLTLATALLILITLGLSTYSALLRIDSPSQFYAWKASIDRVTYSQPESVENLSM